MSTRKTDEDWEQMLVEMWEEIKDHSDTCDCVTCWEYYVFTEK